MMPTISGSSPQRQYRRGYAACAVCRSHKVRCVLGTGPPCAKCRREHRECVFDRTRRGPRTRDVSQWTELAQPPADNEVARGEAQRHTRPRDTTSHSSTSESNRDDASVPRASDPTDTWRESSGNASQSQVPAQPPASLLERTICPTETLGFFNEPRVSQEDSNPASITVSPLPLQSDQQKRAESCNLWHPPTVHELSQIDDEVFDVWNRIPYVRMGWFTAREALTFMDLFHRHFASFCPAFMSQIEVGSPRYARIAQEPMLCTTILMITSRFFSLPGPGGLTRSYLIHHRLWQQCERLIQLLMFGQEKYLRGSHTWGTLQSLLLLSEWHPRALRSVSSSSQNDTWEGREPGRSDQGSSERTEREQPHAARYEQELSDQTKQSDRVSWMMIGTALNLAHEAGVFVDSCHLNDTQGSELLGSLRTRKLLYVYVTNLSVRLGFQNTFIQDIIVGRAVLPAEGIGHSGTESGDVSMELWLSLVRLSRTASAMFFRSPVTTKSHLRNGDYIVLLQSFVVTLSKWHDGFVASQPGECASSFSSKRAPMSPQYGWPSEKTLTPLYAVMDQDIQSLLLIEYHNLRTYTHALAIQAILDRTGSQSFSLCQKKDRFELLSTCYLPEDFAFIHEVITNSTIVLQNTISMAAGSRLRFVPIRQLHCILSAFLFLFKAITISTSREDVQTSLSVLEQCVKALGEADVDELDVSRDTLAFLRSHVRKIRHQVNIFFSAPTNPDEALVAQVLADLSEPLSGDDVSASQSLLLGVNWNQEVFAMPGLPADLAASWPSLDTSSRQTGLDAQWQVEDMV